MSNIVEMIIRKCAECGGRANKEYPLVSETGEAFSKWYCDKHLPKPMNEDDLRLLLDVRDAEIEWLRAALNKAEHTAQAALDGLGLECIGLRDVVSICDAALCQQHEQPK